MKRISFLLIMVLAHVAFATREGEVLSSGADEVSIAEKSLPDAGEPSFALDVQLDQKQSSGEQAVYVVKAQLEANKELQDRIGQLELWWITPSGARARFELRSFDQGLWVSRLSTHPESGFHRLVLLAILDGDGRESAARNEAAGVGEVWEDDYQLEVPSLELKLLNRRRISDGSGANSPLLGKMEINREKDTLQEQGTSMALIALIIGLTNVLVLALLGGLHLVMAHWPHMVQRFRKEGLSEVSIREALQEIFNQGRLFDVYEEPLEIEDDSNQEKEAALGGKIKDVFNKVLSKETKAEDEAEDSEPKSDQGDSDEETQVNLHDLSF